MTDRRLHYFSQMATKALLYEISLSPKPGLVDRFDNGAHQDMTFSTFIDSILALAPHFCMFLQIGFDYSGEDFRQLFELLRQQGIKAEQDMFLATNGINTHKGANFSLAVLLGATGVHLRKHPHFLDDPSLFSVSDSTAICQTAAKMCHHLLEADFSQLASKKELSYGEKLYLRYGIKGPRGEAADGFPTLRNQALPFFREKLNHKDAELAQLQLLTYLMSLVEDGNLIHRGGLEAWETVKEECSALLQQTLDKIAFIQQLKQYNALLISRHLSPGGSADLLALTFYFAFLEGIF
ncbi:triphosphoribosyl-dephospho-CoA synthase CitG [Streptococcus ovuberis]|uniref:Probable 2-(5''-triphosphoribosyl)-3'-dephosphocoenzyme-A synthase n=1 Tax=Streptococcus ovuberis TaxID=1936207 RepID=A0A7X6S1S2_9STRE|nr:triphosphoribosyl-dephospho-CoA synthase CitG [Streptococcus ovuberis]NKZ20660.1 triphosphoribosyl-dephospho-CoA synthase CitG [Streptococcus ovuberis]